MALVDLVMPKMGESITEATILKWFKHPGETVKMDEAVLEIATDKVDSEVPSTPSAVEGTSLSTLSVAISRTASSIFTVSPGCLNHFNIVASVILSPILGITRSTKAICNCRFYIPFWRDRFMILF